MAPETGAMHIPSTYPQRVKYPKRALVEKRKCAAQAA